ncbi:pseudouridine synthase [Desulfonatronum thiosulfatophilum]|uniref:pseudouridine synthase n=1 Tax=Desulfonatronum thiosulfatophilum TaxID=617002 RepID=UPI001FC8EFEF|nr:pseudouridine synthase [Desulfonatronum thiosulfatophilum]
MPCYPLGQAGQIVILTRRGPPPYCQRVTHPESNQTVRLNKVLAQSGLCSRRAADEMILEGAVMVNGEVTRTPGIRIDPGRDRVRVRGKDIPLTPEKHRELLYLAMHKPPDVVTTAHDPQGRKTVMDLLSSEIRRRRPFPVGRLDLLSEGLLLLTTDGETALRMTHPRWEHPKTYHVRVRGHVTREKLETMRSGMQLAEGERLAPVEVRIIGNDGTSYRQNGRHSEGGVILEMTLRQGVNRQIRRMCRDLRLHVLGLRRLSQGPIQLGDLPSGACRSLTPKEINALLDSLDLNRRPA